MLFNSIEFAFVFLPITLLGYLLIIRSGRWARFFTIWLSLTSLFFYGWWDVWLLPVLMGSIIGNFAIGSYLSRTPTDRNVGRRRHLAVLGIVGNLALLGYFKYINFLVDIVGDVTGSHFHHFLVVLPIAISFYTFTQITYIADSYKGRSRQYTWWEYCLFVSFFPHLIAGPIVHHYEMMPQFAAESRRQRIAENLAVGISLFAIGLFKKVVIADSLSPVVGAIFGAAGNGADLTLWEAWLGALAYTLQLYFDFSGYSEMALGLARMFGVKFPMNFFSPYKSQNIIEFWRRWHMTLSRFLRDYLYIPLGGNRLGPTRRYVNLLTTMLLGGLWHGAGWTFVLWGALHGLYLCINHFWNWLAGRIGWHRRQNWLWAGLAAPLLTFLAVVVGWVFFRADSVATASNILRSMFGAEGVVLPFQVAARLGLADGQLGFVTGALWPNIPAELGASRLAVIVVGLLVVVWVVPNTIQLLRRFDPALDTDSMPGESHLSWRLNWRWGILCGLVAAAGIIGMLVNQSSEFLYFQF